MAAEITIIDRPCGTGKSTELINRMRQMDENGKFLIVTPLLDEVRRFQQAAKGLGIEVHTPTDSVGTKTSDLRRLLEGSKNIVTTHAMYLRMVEFARPTDNLLEGYHIVIDEVPNPVEPGPNIGKADFWSAIIGLELATIEPKTGQVCPTLTWHVLINDGVKQLYNKVHRLASDGRLFANDDELLALAIPIELIHAGRKLDILTYLSGGSLIRAYLDAIKVRYQVEVMDVADEEAWRSQMRDLISIEGFTVPSGVYFTHSGQTERTTKQAGVKVGKAIDNLFTRRWNGVNANETLVTCAHANWFADDSRTKPAAWAEKSGRFGDWSRDKSGEWSTTGLRWCANTTRGSNNWIDCTHAIYLYDQNPNVTVSRFLNRDGQDFRDAFALTELVQWLWRTRIRRKLPITVALPSRRMQNLLINWLDHGKVSSETPTKQSKCQVNWQSLKLSASKQRTKRRAA